MDMGFSKLWELVVDRVARRAVIHGVTKSRTQLSDWTDWKMEMDFPDSSDGKDLPVIRET